MTAIFPLKPLGLKSAVPFPLSETPFPLHVPPFVPSGESVIVPSCSQMLEVVQLASGFAVTVISCIKVCSQGASPVVKVIEILPSKPVGLKSAVPFPLSEIPFPLHVPLVATSAESVIVPSASQIDCVCQEASGNGVTVIFSLNSSEAQLFSVTIKEMV